MFHIDATFEDIRIIANSPSGIAGVNWEVTFHDGFTGEQRTIGMPQEHLQMVLAFNLDPNGEPSGFEKFYEVLEPYFVLWPNTIRPIP